MPRRSKVIRPEGRLESRRDMTPKLSTYRVGSTPACSPEWCSGTRGPSLVSPSRHGEAETIFPQLAVLSDVVGCEPYNVRGPTELRGDGVIWPSGGGLNGARAGPRDALRTHGGISLWASSCWGLAVQCGRDGHSVRVWSWTCVVLVPNSVLGRYCSAVGCLARSCVRGRPRGSRSGLRVHLALLRVWE